MMASRINHKSAKIPPPTTDLIGRMAAAGYVRTIEMSGREQSTAFVCLPGDVRDAWMAVAKSMYAVVAVTGGAAIEEVGESKE